MGSSQISGDALLTTAAGSSKLSAGVRERKRRAETQDLARARDFFQGTLDSLASHIAVLDDRGEIIMTNRAWRTLALANDAVTVEGVGANYLAACDAAIDDELATQTGAGLRAIIAGASNEFTIEYPCHGPDVERWFALRASRYQGPGPARVVVAHEDITVRRAAEAEVVTQAALLDEVDVAVIAIEPEGRVKRWNDGAERLLGWTRAEAVGRSAAQLIVADGEERAQEVIAKVRRYGRWEGMLTVDRVDGSTFPAYVRNRLTVDGDGHPTGRVAVVVDMTDSVASERALLSAQNYMHAVAESMGEGLFTLDPDGRVVFMNEAAEKLLGWTAEELEGRVMHDMTHSRRPDGTELLLEDSPILRAHRDGVTVHVEDEVFTCRDGSALPVDYTAAPFVTDDGVEGCVIVFEDITERKARQQSMEADVETLSWIGRIRDALANDRFVLYEQPIIELSRGVVVQRELLLRMREPTGEIVAPGAFLPIAEQYGLIGDIDRWVIRHAVEIAAVGGGVELNLSASSIGDPGVLDGIERALERTGVDPRTLVFEITETALITDEAAAKTFADRVHALGCKLALDDFGTGYGGFTYLKQFAVDFLKIDIEFVRDLPTNPASQHVVEAVVALARAFGLHTVAEGVEDAQTLDLLRKLGVDFAQGYHIARPRPLARSVTPEPLTLSPEARPRPQAQRKEPS
jgi:PAS domain S-box-containing protein